MIPRAIKEKYIQIDPEWVNKLGSGDDVMVNHLIDFEPTGDRWEHHRVRELPNGYKHLSVAASVARRTSKRLSVESRYDKVIAFNLDGTRMGVDAVWLSPYAEEEPTVIPEQKPVVNGPVYRIVFNLPSDDPEWALRFTRKSFYSPRGDELWMPFYDDRVDYVWMDASFPVCPQIGWRLGLPDSLDCHVENRVVGIEMKHTGEIWVYCDWGLCNQLEHLDRMNGI